MSDDSIKLLRLEKYVTSKELEKMIDKEILDLLFREDGPALILNDELFEI